MSDDSDVEVKFGADTEGLEKGSEKAKEQIEKIKESLESLKESSEGVKEIFEKAFEFAGIEIGLDAFKEWVKSSAELGEQMERTGAILGITSSQASELAGMAKMTGTDFGSLEHAVERFDLGLAEATKAGSRMAEGLRVLGLSAKEFVGVPTAERLNIIAEAFSKFEDGPNKTAAAMALLGRAGAEMIPFLDKGREGMRELHDVLLRTGAVMSNEMAASFAKTMEDINEMSLAWQGLSNRIFGVVNPAIDAAIKEITKLVESMNAQSIRAGIEALTDAGIDLSAAIAEYAVRAMAAIDKLIAKLGGLRSAAQSLDTFAAAMEGDNAALVRVGKGLWGALTGADDGSKDAALAATESLDSKLKAIEKSAEAAKAKLHSMIQVVASGSPYGSLDAHAFDKPKPDVGQMKLGGGGNKDEAFKDAELEANKEIEVAKSVTTAREKELDEQLKTHQITMNQWLSQTEQALQSEYNSVKDAYDKEAAKAGLTSQQIIAIKTKEAKALDDIAQKERDAQYKAAEASQKSWDDATKEINSAFTSQIDGLLKGTTNWATALKNVLATLTEDVIKFFAEWALKAVENQALQIASQNSITSGILAAMGLQAAGQAAASKPGIIAQIGADTGEAYAGFAAFLAPILGPAAPAAAAGLSAQVSSTALGLASFDVGSWELPHDQLAMVHAGEMIVPSRGGVADEFRAMASGGGGGGSTTHNHTWNVNGAQDPHVVARTVAHMWEKNMSLRPKGY